MMARSGANIVFGSRVLMGEKSECFGGSLIREDGFRESCVGGIEVRALWWLASATSWVSGVGRWWEESHSVLEARFCEKVVLGSRV